MRADKLIEILEKLPPDSIVELYDWSQCFRDQIELKEEEIFYRDNVVTFGVPDT